MTQPLSSIEALLVIRDAEVDAALAAVRSAVAGIEAAKEGERAVRLEIRALEERRAAEMAAADAHERDGRPTAGELSLSQDRWLALDGEARAWAARLAQAEVTAERARRELEARQELLRERMAARDALSRHRERLLEAAAAAHDAAEQDERDELAVRKALARSRGTDGE